MANARNGFSLIELIVIVSIIGILVMIAVPNLNRSHMNLMAGREELEANIRMVRGNATGRGVHYRVTLHPDSYEIDRLKLAADGVTWVHDSLYSVQTVQLPKNITITTGAGMAFEFNSRGLLEKQADGTPAVQVSVTLRDSRDNSTQSVSIWPSGQILRN
ncbi:MAG: prepilin-type N-terminal cleavage/methylation domain-containing protein [Deltaproteobacteria bacterium]|nr:prepilin-type N-terminal cleavage/methylation domain-containing protein [Deltaproteobacteria bacterium]